MAKLPDEYYEKRKARKIILIYAPIFLTVPQPTQFGVCLKNLSQQILFNLRLRALKYFRQLVNQITGRFIIAQFPPQRIFFSQFIE